MRKLQAVFWDVDGTLADTELYGHRLAFNQAFQSLELGWDWDIPLYIELLKIQGGARRIQYYADTNNISIKDELINLIHNRKQHFYQIIITNGHVPLRIGVKRLVSELARNNINQWIVTTSSRIAINSLLEKHFELSHPFKGAITYEDVEEHKPSPDAYINALVQSKVNPLNCLAIEDSVPGLSSARKASIPCLITLTKWNKFSSTSMSEAKAVVNHLGERSDPTQIFQGSSCKEGYITLKYLENLLNVV